MNNQLDNPKNFLACVFDFSFSEFIVPKIIKIIFAIAIVLAAFGALMILIGGLAAGTVASGLGGIIIAPIAFILYVLAARIWLELILVVFRIAENTSKMVQEKQGDQPTETPASVKSVPETPSSNEE